MLQKRVCERQVKRLSDENTELTAAEAEWTVKEKMLNEKIREMERQLDNLSTLVSRLSTLSVCLHVLSYSSSSCQSIAVSIVIRRHWTAQSWARCQPESWARRQPEYRQRWKFAQLSPCLTTMRHFPLKGIRVSPARTCYTYHGTDSARSGAPGLSPLQIHLHGTLFQSASGNRASPTLFPGVCQKKFLFVWCYSALSALGSFWWCSVHRVSKVSHPTPTHFRLFWKNPLIDRDNPACYRFAVSKWVVIYAITGAETIKRRTRAAYSCLVAQTAVYRLYARSVFDTDAVCGWLRCISVMCFCLTLTIDVCFWMETECELRCLEPL